MLKRKKIYVGELRERLTIKSAVIVKSDKSGANITQFKIFKNCWAKVVDTGGSEEIEGKVVYNDEVSFIIRYDEIIIKNNINEKIIIYEDKEYDVVSYKRIGFKEYISLKAIYRG